MKKVGQITLYDYNYGSVLQCYATQRIVNSLGYHCDLFCEVHDNLLIHKARYLFGAGLKMLQYPQKAKKFWEMMQAQRKTALSAMTQTDFEGIQEFIACNISKRQQTYAQMKAIAKSDEYIAFLSGSDQIWNGSWFLRNKSFFLRFAPQQKRIAWAPSFGTQQVASYNVRRFRYDIGAYASLSAREASGVKIITELTGKKAVQIIDPVLQIPAEEWRLQYFKQKGCSYFKPYLFCYFLNEPTDVALAFLKQQADAGYVLIAFASNYASLRELNGARLMGGSPWDYLSLLDGAVQVCSDSFHALAFSLVFHKEVLIFRRQYTHSADQSERIVSLLTRVGLIDRFVERDEDLHRMQANIDFAQADALFREETERGKSYLKNALRGIE